MKRLPILTLAIACSTAFAQDDYTKTINQLGVQSTTSALAYFSVVEGLTLNCQYGYIYVDITTDFGRAAYAQLLAAKNTGRMLSRIEYVQSGGSGTECTLTIVEIQN